MNEMENITNEEPNVLGRITEINDIQFDMEKNATEALLIGGSAVVINAIFAAGAITNIIKAAPDQYIVWLSFLGLGVGSSIYFLIEYLKNKHKLADQIKELRGEDLTFEKEIELLSVLAEQDPEARKQLMATKYLNNINDGTYQVDYKNGYLIISPTTESKGK